MPLEWLIDIIKEWVITQAYATEAWVEAAFLKLTDVPEWTNPLSVAGELSPDATCTYLKAGTYNDKPYYRRQDGAWHIWFLPIVPRWYISIELGDVGVAFWYRDSSSVEGVYQPEENAEGVATVAKGYNYLKTGFVDRGDPDAADYVKGDFTTDDAWHDLDLSAIVPDKAKAILVHLKLLNSSTLKQAWFRKKGNVNERNVSRATTQVGGIFLTEDLVCPVNSGRKIQYKFSAGLWVLITFTVKGWWL